MQYPSNILLVISTKKGAFATNVLLHGALVLLIGITLIGITNTDELYLIQNTVYPSITCTTIEKNAIRRSRAIATNVNGSETLKQHKNTTIGTNNNTEMLFFLHLG